MTIFHIFNPWPPQAARGYIHFFLKFYKFVVPVYVYVSVPVVSRLQDLLTKIETNGFRQNVANLCVLCRFFRIFDICFIFGTVAYIRDHCADFSTKNRKYVSLFRQNSSTELAEIFRDCIAYA